MKNVRITSAGITLVRWLVAPSLVLLVVLLIFSNLVLQTRAVRDWTSNKLERRLGFDLRIRSLSWTPWTGIQVRNLLAEIPDTGNGSRGHLRPLYELDIDVEISFGALLSGKLQVREICVRRGVVALPLELPSLLPGEPERIEDRRSDLAGGKKGDGKEKPSQPRPGRMLEPEERPVAMRENVRSPVHPTVRLIIDRCDVEVYSIYGQGAQGLRMRNLRGELPLRGKDAEGWISCDEIALGGKTLMEGLEVPLFWSRPFLQLPARTFDWKGQSLQAEGYCRMVGIPNFSVNISVPAGPMGPVAITPGSSLEIKAEALQVDGFLQGTLTALDTWWGNFEAEAHSLMVSSKRGESRKFEYGQAISSLRGGTLRVMDARLQSEQLSFLGNGVIVPDGRLRGVVRVVADPSHAEMLTRFAVGAMLTGGWTRSWLAPLGTPDRQFRDLHMEGTLRRFMIDVGRSREEMEIRQIWDRVSTFLQGEMREQRQENQDFPSSESLP